MWIEAKSKESKELSKLRYQPAVGGYFNQGVIHETFLLRIYAQKAAPGIHKGKNRRLKFFLHFVFAAKNGGL